MAKAIKNYWRIFRQKKPRFPAPQENKKKKKARKKGVAEPRENLKISVRNSGQKKPRKKRKKHPKNATEKPPKPPEKYRSKIAENQADWAFSLSSLC